MLACGSITLMSPRGGPGDQKEKCPLHHELADPTVNMDNTSPIAHQIHITPFG